jgi:hypothetical protein
MPAVNMAGATVVPANPAAGKAVLMSPFNGPKNSPMDARTITGWANGRPTYANDPTNYSTGGLSTGIGYGLNGPIINPVAPASIKAAGFDDDDTVGVTLPTGVAATTSILVAIGGGKSTANVAGVAPTVPYTAGFGLQAFGAGASRDAGAGPAFTGFGLKMVTGAAALAAAIEAGFTNRTDRAMVAGESAFGSATAASAAIA